ncbi:MAG TPA: M14 family metallopeptidase [Anaerolineae bacterium]|nr:M14 family metallopeptidase [Anaerolineae bacterium]
MTNLKFDHYYRYDELTNILNSLVEEYPNLARIESIGKSYEGREVWLVTVTDFSTGADKDKPALWVDGNIHASEVSPASACVYFINYLLTNYGKDADVTRALATRAFYICPRVNPDSAELALADKPKIVRSSVRPYPHDEEPIEGLIREDLDGDGRLLNMRIQDPNGPWKAHSDDPRIMIQRDPAETGGTYYRILPEGRLENYDGVTFGVAPVKEGLDLNRNFPMGWRLEGEQRGAGPFPASEPEVRNLMTFITEHPNITGAIAFHTWSGVLLRPYDDRSDDEFPAEDLWTYKKIGDKGTEITQYPNVSVFHDFKYHPKQVITGSFDTWMYEHRGVFGWTVEIWSPQKQAGIEKYKFIDWDREHPIEDDLKMMKWNDEVLGGKGYVNWYKFNHPQLGEIEIGGWDMGYCWRNPPPEFLEKELALFPPWLVWCALISPKLELHDASAKALGENTYRVRAVVQNVGWLPTYVTKKALEKKLLRGVIVEVELPAGATLETGKAREDIGQLEGRAYKDATVTVWNADPTEDRAKIEWTVKAPNGGTLKIVAKHERAGTVRTELKLG